MLRHWKNFICRRMSILHTTEEGWLISHKNYIDKLYENVFTEEETSNYQLKSVLFKIIAPFTTKNYNQSEYNLKVVRSSGNSKKKHSENEDLKKEIISVKQCSEKLRASVELMKKNINSIDNRNIEALEAANSIYDESGKTIITNAYGANEYNCVIKTIQGCNYLFPTNCKFYCKDINEIEKHLLGQQFDLIVLDPPWWNKYIRRKKAKSNHAYKMIHNNDLKNLPLEKLLRKDGLVVVWCTNSSQHLDYLINNFFPKWNVKFLCKWYWLKITVNGDPVCNFSEPPGKQPFEQIVLASNTERNDLKLLNGKIVMSVPSALHSHKPPLIELLKPFITEEANCLEIFSRYLLPGWTSYGLETLRFQHVCLYEKENLLEK